MPATEETYRRQTTLHIVFAVSSVVLAAVTVWMVLADHLRPWKSVQREFQKIETDKLAASEREKLREQEENSKAAIDAINQKIAGLQSVTSENQRLLGSEDAEIAQAQGRFDLLDTRRKFQKAELDSKRSFYDGMIDRDERGRAREYLQSAIVPLERQLEETIRGHEAAARTLARARLERGLLASEVVEVASAPPPGTPAEAAGFRKGDVVTVEDFRAFKKAAEEAREPRPDDAPRPVAVTVVRAGRDGRQTPRTVTARVAPRAANDEVAQAMGFDALGMVVTPLTAEVLEKRRGDLTRDRDRITRALEQKHAQYGSGSGFAGLTNRIFGTLRGLPIIDLAAPPTKIQQISLPDLLINYNFKEVPRYDRCTTCHLGIDRPGFDKDADGKPMPAVYHSHPHLAGGATAIDPQGNVVAAGLYLDSNGPHPINKFGCTICHGGQGSGTSFTFASHSPNTLEEKEEWEQEYDWREMHHWDEPMLIDRFVESSCVKCHHQVTDVPQATKLQAGYERITKFGCTGCHTIGGEGSFGPDLTDNRQVGPNLKHLASKVTKDWAVKWIKNPHAFRPDTRMPRFYEVANNESPADGPKVHAEVHAMAHYLFEASAPPEDFVDPPAEGDAEKGKDLFFQKGCMACHAHKDYAPDTLPETVPAFVREYAKANYGPNLSNIAAKFDEKTGFKWLANWLKAPESYHPKTLMPNLQLSWEDSADIARFLLSVKPDSTPSRWSAPDFQVPPADSPEVKQGLDELVALYLSKAKTYKKRTVLLSEVDRTIAGMSQDEKLSYVGEKTISRLGCFGCHNISGFETAKPIGTPLNGWGIKSPSKLDFGHIIEYMADHFRLEDEPGAGSPFAEEHPEGVTKIPTEGGGALVPGGEGKATPEGDLAGKIADYDGTDEFYKEQLDEHTRMGFLYQKLHRPRSYDYGKNSEDLKSWDDRLRMPRFSWADDPKAIEEVMTFVLGLTGERIPGKYLPNYKPATRAVAQGEKLLNRYNCRGCHVLEMPKYNLAAGTKMMDALPNFLNNVAASYTNRSKDYLAFYGKDNPEFAAVGGLTYDPALTKDPRLAENLKPARGGKFVDADGNPVDPKDTLILSDATEGQAVSISGMPTYEEEGRVYVSLWRPVTIRGYTFNVGDTIVVEKTKIQFTPPEGGDFAWLYASVKGTDEPFAPFWNRLPPPLLREGKKVQTPWLTGFLQDPYPIRPATQLRMPKFHYGTTPEEMAEMGLGSSASGSIAREESRGETRDLANYFAARDGAEFPYQDIPERDRPYLEAQEKAHEDYLAGGWQIITKGLCVQCHAIGTYKPTGGAENVNGPDLRQVAPRFRSRYLQEWLAQPARLVPYTAMPQNIPPGGPPAPGVPPSFENKPFQQITAMRDTLLNFTTAVEQQLAAAKPPEPSQPAEAPKPAEGEEE